MGDVDFRELSASGTQVRRAVRLLRGEFEARVAAGDKEGAEELYQGVYELREWMNRVHAGTVWRTPK